MPRDTLSEEDYQRLLALRTGLRRFLHWSEERAREAGLTPAQHQLLLAVRGHPGSEGPTIGELADYLLLRHHSAVELVQRAVAAGLIERREDPADRRLVRLRLTGAGEAALAALTSAHLEELARLARQILEASEGISIPEQLHGRLVGKRPGAGDHAGQGVLVRRVYEEPGEADGKRVLVDRLWPRGVGRDEARLDEWFKQVAPSASLRRWYGHDPSRFKEFSRRYRTELSGSEQSGAVSELVALARGGSVTLVTATRDLERSGAAVLAGELRRRVAPGRR